MKNIKSLIFTALITVLFINGILAQDSGISVSESISGVDPYSTLNPININTRILYVEQPSNNFVAIKDYTIIDTIIDPTLKYDFIKTATSEIPNNCIWKQAYFQIFNSYIEPTTIPSIEFIDSLASNYARQKVNPIYLLNFTYNTIKEDAIDLGLLQLIGGQLYETDAAKTVSPYEINITTIASTYKDSSYSLKTKFYLGQEFINGNNISESDIISIDFDDGMGFRVITLGSTTEINYSFEGEKHIQVMVLKTLDDNSILRAVSSFKYLVKNLSIPAEDYYEQIVSEVPWDTFYPRYDMSILYKYSGTQLKKPIIVVEGFDPDNVNNYEEQYLCLNQQNMAEYLRQNGYDLVFINFRSGADYIQHNAMALVDLINKVNNRKTTTEEVIIVAASMGGLVARYALTYMENILKTPHSCRLLYTIDSPHQGANIPVGDQCYLDFYAFKSQTAEHSVYLLGTPAALQMLYYNIKDILGQTKNAFYHDLETIGNYPNNTKMIAISDGNGEGLPILGNNGVSRMSFSTTIVSYYYEVGWGYPDVYSYAYSFPSPSFPTGRYKVFEGLTFTDFWYSIPTAWKEVNVDVPNTITPFDNAPGGTIPTDSAIAASNTGGYGDITTEYNRHCFIPTISSLDLRDANGNPKDPFYKISDNTHTTPFDEIYYDANTESQNHVAISQDIAEYVKGTLNKYFIYPSNVHTIVNSDCSVTVKWTDNNLDETAFYIWYSTDPQNFSAEPNIVVGPLNGIFDEGSCQITGLTMGVKYYIMVKSVTPTGVNFSGILASVTVGVPVKPSLSGVLVATPSVGKPYPSLNFSVSNESGNVTYFEIHRKMGVSGSWQKISEIYTTSQQGTFTEVVDCNNDYYYRVRAANGLAYSDFSDEIYFSLYFLPPTNIQHTLSYDPIENVYVLYLNWIDNSSCETGTAIYLHKIGEDWSSPAKYIGGNITSCIIGNGHVFKLDPLATYEVKIAPYFYDTDIAQVSNTYTVFMPNRGYTNHNNAKRLLRSSDNQLISVFMGEVYDGYNHCYADKLYFAKSNSNGVNWEVMSLEDPYGDVGSYPTIAQNIENNKALYLLRGLTGGVNFDSVNYFVNPSSYTRLSSLSSGYNSNPNPASASILADEYGTLHCVWPFVEDITNMVWDRTHFDYTRTVNIYINYAKRIKGKNDWENPIAINPRYSVSKTGNTPPVINYVVPHPSMVLSKEGTVIKPHIAWEANGKYVSLYYSDNLGTGVQITPVDVNINNPCMSVSNQGLVTLSWEQASDIYCATKSGVSWNTSINVSNNSGTSQQVTSSYDSEGALQMLWFDNSTTGFTQAAYPSYEQALAPGMGNTNASMTNGEALIWSSQQPTADMKTTAVIPTEEDVTTIDPTQIFYRRYKNNTWSPVYRLTASATASVYPSLPLIDNAAQMGFIWTEGTGVKYKRLPDIDPPSVTVSYPNGGEVLFSGRRYDIAWTGADNRGIKEYSVYYTSSYIIQDEPNTMDAVTIWHQIGTVGGDANTFSWRVPYITSTNCRIKIVALDSTGNRANDISDKNFSIRSRDIVVVATDKALAYNNAGKIARSADGRLHVCYNSIDSIHYMSSTDEGQTWSSPLTLDNGSLPAVAYDGKNLPVVSWIKQWDFTTGGGVFYSRQTSTGWSMPETLVYMDAVPWDYTGGYSPPAMSIRNDTVSLVYEYSYGGGIPPYIAKGWALHHMRFALDNSAGKKDTIIDSYTETVEPPIWKTPTSASIGTDVKGYDHISWHRKDKVYYRMRKPDGTYGEIIQLSGAGCAENPSVGISGVAVVVWEEDGDVYKRTGYDQKWEPAVNVSNSAAASMMPYVCGSDVLWTEDVLSDYEVYLSTYSTAKMTYDVVENLSYTDYASIFPHETKLQTTDGTKTYRIWAEEVEPLVLWGLTFMADTTGLEPTYALDVGLAEPSIFSVQRDGYITYETGAKTDGEFIEPYKTVDYDTTALIYSFDNLDPAKKYKITLSFYQETGQVVKLKPMVNKLPLGEVKVNSGQEEVLDKPLPEAGYKDGQIILTIEKIKGPIAVCGKILIYETARGNGHGGTQSEEIISIAPNYINKLYQNRPNPFGSKTTFMYQIKNKRQVSLKIYNALGQLVKTLVNETKPAGIYQVNWDGSDGGGLMVSSGIYIYRLQAGDFVDTKKMVMVR